MVRIKEFYHGLITGFKTFGHLITSFVNTVLLTIVYIFGVGITFLIAKVLRKKLLEKNITLDQKTYWQDLNLTTENIEKYYRPF